MELLFTSEAMFSWTAKTHWSHYKYDTSPIKKMFTMAPPELFYLYYTDSNLLICHLALATIQSTLLIVSHEKHGFKHGDGSWNAKFWLPGHICSHHSIGYNHDASATCKAE